MKLKKIIKKLGCKLSIFKNKLIIKAIVIFLLISIIPVGIFSYITYKSSLNILIDEYISSNQKTLIQGSKVIENHFQQLKDISISPYKKMSFLLNLADVESQFVKMSYNDNFLKDMFFYNDAIESIYFYATRSGILYYYSRRYSGYQLFREVENEPWYQKTINAENGQYISPLHNFVDYVGVHVTQDKPIYSVNQSIINIETKEVLGVISLNVLEDVISDFTRSFRDENEGILILTPDGEILYSYKVSNEIFESIQLNEQIAAKMNGFLEIEVLDNKYIVIYSFLKNMFLAKVISYKQFEKKAILSIGGILKSSALIFFLILLFSIAVIIKLHSLIRMVEANMERISEGKFDIKMSYNGNDELKRFINNFNDMAQKINHLINSEYKSKIALKNAQIMALQTQINPHFMYNSLQVVSTFALRSDSMEIYRMLNAISNLLKYSLGKKDSMVSIETEIEYIQNYLHVQEARFGKELNIDFDLDDEVLEEKIPRLILQPLVENCLLHQPLENNTVNTIRVEAKKEDECCKIVVQDNGQGINAAMLEKINSFINDEDYLLDDDDHIGLHNVISRIRLVYNDHAIVNVTSKPGRGTKIAIMIPVGTKNV